MRWVGPFGPHITLNRPKAKRIRKQEKTETKQQHNNEKRDAEEKPKPRCDRALSPMITPQSRRTREMPILWNATPCTSVYIRHLPRHRGSRCYIKGSTSAVWAMSIYDIYDHNHRQTASTTIMTMTSSDNDDQEDDKKGERQVIPSEHPGTEHQMSHFTFFTGISGARKTVRPPKTLFCSVFLEERKQRMKHPKRRKMGATEAQLWAHFMACAKMKTLFCCGFQMCRNRKKKQIFGSTKTENDKKLTKHLLLLCFQGHSCCSALHLAKYPFW